jgi:uncharacterized protein YkwD
MRPAPRTRVHRPFVQVAGGRLLDGRRPVEHQVKAQIASLLRTVLLVSVALTVPASASAAAPCADGALIPDSANILRSKTATLCLLNSERQARGLAPLSANGQLGKAAVNYSATMVRQQFFDHVSPSGSTLKNRVRGGTSYLRGRLRSWSLGENIGWGSGVLATPQRIVGSWMSSPSHRRNILDRGFRHIGIGIVTGAPDDVQGLPAATYTTDFGHRILG